MSISQQTVSLNGVFQLPLAFFTFVHQILISVGEKENTVYERYFKEKSAINTNNNQFFLLGAKQRGW